MFRLHLIHWRPDEAGGRIDQLKKQGYRVEVEHEQGNAILRRLKADPPDLVVIDLSRMPSHGRDIAVGLRISRTTRNVPILFVEGKPEKVRGIQLLLPDASYLGWDEALDNLDRLIENPPENPVVPKSILAGYSGTPLPKKLGIKKDTLVTLVGAPSGFEDTLGQLPAGATLTRQIEGKSDLIICFVRSRKELLDQLEGCKGLMAEKAGLWLAWPKKTSGISSDLTQMEVRSLGLASGLVDYKVCAIDAVWAGLKFAKRK
jgi:CheY-like chemotaxis protein